MTFHDIADPDLRAVGVQAFQGWQKGEQTGDYADFIALLSEPTAFERFSHPFSPRGIHEGVDGHMALSGLIAERTGTPNHLTFTDVALLEGDNGQIGFLFDSGGTVAGGDTYRGYNCIVLTMRQGRIVGFREYLGDIEPLWFQKRNY
jgi:ketosteroid isomerase-like protein